MVASSAALLRFARGPVQDGVALQFDGADVSPDALQRADNAPRGEAGVLDLSGRDLQNASLREANLSGANLSNAKMSGASAAGIRLRSSLLEGAGLECADLVAADLAGVHAGEATFKQALLEDANLEDAHLRFTDFSEAILDGADLSRADLWGAKFRESAADRVRFQDARMDESILTQADLSGADFTRATLRRADFALARLKNANFREAVLDGANFAGADLQGALLPNLSLTSCNLSKASFSGAWLERTRFRAQQLGGQVGEELAGDLGGAIDSYIVLERNFISLGNSEDASWAYLQRRRVGRRLHAKQATAHLHRKDTLSAISAGLYWVGDTLADWLCNYGESLYRVARAFVCILLFFAVVYWLSGSLTLREGFSTPHHTWINYLLFSLNSMTTVGTSEIALRPTGELGTLLSSVQTVLGTILLGLFGFVLGARIRS